MPPQFQLAQGSIDVRITGNVVEQLKEQKKLADEQIAKLRQLAQEASRPTARISAGIAATPEQLQNATRMAEITRSIFTTQVALGAVAAAATAKMVSGSDAGALAVQRQITAVKTLADTFGKVDERTRKIATVAATAVAPAAESVKKVSEAVVAVAPKKMMAGSTEEGREVVRAELKNRLDQAKQGNERLRDLLADLSGGQPSPAYVKTGKGQGRSDAAKILYEQFGKDVVARGEQGRIAEQMAKLFTPKLEVKQYAAEVKADLKGTQAWEMFLAAQRRKDTDIETAVLGGPQGGRRYQKQILSGYADIASDAANQTRKAILERETIGSDAHLQALGRQTRAIAEAAVNMEKGDAAAALVANEFLKTDVGLKLLQEKLEHAQTGAAALAQTERKTAEVLASLSDSAANQQRIRDQVSKRLTEEFGSSREKSIAAGARLNYLQTPEGFGKLRGQAMDDLTSELRGKQEAGLRTVAKLAEMQTPQGRLNLQAQAQTTHADAVGNLAQDVERRQAQARYLSTPVGAENLRRQVSLTRELTAAQKQIDWSKTVAETGRWNAYLGTAETRLQRIRQGLQPIESLSTKVFAGGLGLMLGTTALASPVAMFQLSTTLKDLGAVIGYSFIPYVDKATGKLRELADAILNADPEKKAQIAKWTAYGTAIAGIGVVAPKVIGAVQGLLPLLKFAGGGLPGLAVGAVAAGVGLAVAKNPELGKELFANLEKTGAAFAKIFEAVRPIVEQVGEGFVRVTNAILPLVTAITEGTAAMLKFGVEAVNAVDRQFGKTAAGSKTSDFVVSPFGTMIQEFKGLFPEAKIPRGKERESLEKIFGPGMGGKMAGWFEDAEKNKKMSSVGAAGIGGQFLQLGDVGAHYQLEALKVPGIQAQMVNEAKRTADGVGGLADLVKEILKQMGNKDGAPPVIGR